MNFKKYQAVILALLIIIIYNFWISPARLELEQQQQNFERIDQELKELNLIDIDSSQTQLSSLDKEILDQAIPSGINQDQVIVLLDELLKKHNVFDNTGFNFQKSAADTKNQIKLLSISLSGKINLQKLPAFLKELESHQRFFYLKSLNLSVENIEELEVANFSISLESYFS